mmetsp:Transcript_16250/g.30735  ORF Transcript_16250/g.30735 Transcript_16250/m.30735 type:complete len:102 (+) Transcript_16250:475-780(+)
MTKLLKILDSMQFALILDASSLGLPQTISLSAPAMDLSTIPMGQSSEDLLLFHSHLLIAKRAKMARSSLVRGLKLISALVRILGGLKEYPLSRETCGLWSM